MAVQITSMTSYLLNSKVFVAHARGILRAQRRIISITDARAISTPIWLTINREQKHRALLSQTNIFINASYLMSRALDMTYR